MTKRPELSSSDSISRRVLEGRIRGLTDAANAAGLRALIVTAPANFYYVSGCFIETLYSVPERSEFAVIGDPFSPILIICNVEESVVAASGWPWRVETYVEFHDDPGTILGRWLGKEVRTGRVGIDLDYLPATRLASIRAAAQEVEVVACDELLARHRALKSEDEIANLRAAAESVHAALRSSLTSGDPGDSERDVMGRAVSALMNDGATGIEVDIASGTRAGVIHSEPSERVLRSGDIVRMDLSARFQSKYLADAARTAFVEYVNDRDLEIYAALVGIQKEVGAAAVAGRPVAELFNIAKSGAEARGLPWMMPHVGHGLGLSYHEPPMIQPYAQEVLTPGTILNIEPLVRIEGRGCFHVEDTLLVTEGDSEWLSQPDDAPLLLYA